MDKAETTAHSQVPKSGPNVRFRAQMPSAGASAVALRLVMMYDNEVKQCSISRK
jgi:hypothetical protein